MRNLKEIKKIGRFCEEEITSIKIRDHCPLTGR